MTVYDEIYRVVSDIPSGRVASYGRIARMVGCGPRQVGYAMGTIPQGVDVPWHRVVNSQGKISPRGDYGSDIEQRQRLLAEGVVFKKSGAIDLDLYGWESLDIEAELADWTEIKTNE